MRTFLDAWFGQPSTDGASFNAKMRRWYAALPAASEVDVATFEPLVTSALSGDLDGWATSPDGRLALAVLLGAVPRGIWPNSAFAWRGNALAVRVADQALAAGDAWPVERRLFLALPFMQEEDLAHVARAAYLFATFQREAPPYVRDTLGMLLSTSHACVEVVTRFGRFPQRNATLGRINTPEEVAFLAGFEPPPACAGTIRF